jgi:NAD(P)-dependent dehydrogenase (short-subunit alcohol dehydrogenase family)
MTNAFAGRVVVVTGAGSGIGRALACRLAAAGARLAISDIDPLGLDETDAEVRVLGGQIRSDRLDVRDRAAMLAYADAVVAEFGAVHVMINNAGVVHGGEFLGMSFGDIERVIDIDWWGVVNGTKAFLPYLIAAGSVGSGPSALVNISSLFGLVPMPGQSAYVAAKYAVRGFTESVRIEMLAAGLPVTVTCVHPGGVKTAIARNGTSNAGADPAGNADLFDRMLARTSPERAAELILRGAARGRPRVLVGTDAWVLYLLGWVNNRLWQRVVAVVMSRLARPSTGRSKQR